MLITPQAPAGEESRVEAVLEAIRAQFGKVPEGMALFAISPELLELRWAGLRYYLSHPRLGMRLLAFIRLLVSERLGAPFCVGMNQAILLHVGVPLEAIEAARRDPAQALLPESELGLLQLVLKATEHPLRVTGEDLEAMRGLGWSDRDVLDAIHHGANNAAADIIYNTYKIGVTSC
ncbi:MAG: hypothetical protein HQL97_04235 [Magnetococcales bacterium]|nr:hypothetical protein [Magnetococcales bacterium]